MTVVKSSERFGGREITILVEVDEPEAASGWGGGQVRSDNVERVTKAAEGLLGDALQLVRSCATEVAEEMTALEDRLRPDEFSVSFAVKMDSALGAVIAKVSAGAQIQVTLTWKHGP
jgi:hypothetical protein